MLSSVLLSGKVVVVSPHLDDAVFSLGATIVRATAAAADVKVLTVFSGDVASQTRAGHWDSRAGFRTEGEAARARRLEDRRACARVGARPVWLPFGDSQYDRHGSDLEVRSAVYGHLAEADSVLLPGFPLSHGDHLWLMRVLLMGGDVPCSRIAAYLEQPYALDQRADTDRRQFPEFPHKFPRSQGAFTSLDATERERALKRIAVGEYRSQLRISRINGLRDKVARSCEKYAWIRAN